MLLNKKIGLAVMLGLFCIWSSVSLANKQLNPKPDLFLLKTYQTDQQVTGWLMSEKLDGVRAYWDGKQLKSRQGNVFSVPSWFTVDFPPFELDGELWLGRQRFEETVSIVRQSNPDKRWQDITYNIFEVPNQKGGLQQRLTILKQYLDKRPTPFIKLIPQVQVDSNLHLQVELKRILTLGGEGLVVRNPSVSYQTGRVKTALKVKQRLDAECRVTGYTNGKGKYQGLVGALKCELLKSQFQHLTSDVDRSIKIGSGLSDEERRSPPEVGRLITFQYMGLTKNGLPRFPVYLRVRAREDLD